MALSVMNAKTLRFFVSGAGSALLFFVLCLIGSSAGLPPFAANLVAYAIAFSLGYLLQRMWTFQSRHPHRHALPRYAAVQTACALFSGAIVQGASHFLPDSPLLISIVATGVAGAASYLASFLWVFPDDNA